MNISSNTDPQITPTTAGGTRARLRGGWLATARVVWVLVALLYVGLLVYALPQFYEEFLISPSAPIVEEWSVEEVLYSFEEAGIAISWYAGYGMAADILFFLISASIGVVIFWRRSEEPLGLLASYVLVGFGVTFSEAFTSLPQLFPQLAALISVLENVHVVGFVLFLLIFPDGRFRPVWTRAGAALVIIYAAANIFFPAAALTEWNEGIGAVFILGIFGLTAYSQWYRFRDKTNVVLRQQIKWLALALAGLFSTFLVIIAAITLIPSLSQPGGPQVIIHLLMLGVLLIPIYMIPISIGIAISRYRLWDIDIVINRSLVYGLVTIALGVVFVAGFVGIRSVLYSTLGGDQPLYPAILSAVIVFGLISPTSRRLRRFVDRRFYDIDLDYTDAARHEAALLKLMAKEEPVSSFGKYKALGLIGRGGMGEVYKSEDPETGQAVAIKTLYIRGEGDAEELVKRFHREAQAIEGLQHDNIVRLIDYGEEDELPYMVMEYVEGKTLSNLIRARQRISLQDALPLFGGISSALDYAHGMGIVHRDIKPSNVIVEDGPPRRAVLMDFGIARMVSAMTALTGTGGMVGTLDYIAPEQIQGAHQVDGRADVYSFGSMAYQTLTGELPFKHRNPGALIMAHLTTPPPDARKVVQDLPRGTAKAVQKAMAKEAGDRFGTAGAFVEAMEAG